MSDDSVRRVAAWDFDGTITERDTLVGDIADQLRGTTTRLAASTLAMVLAVILIAMSVVTHALLRRAAGKGRR